MSNLHPVFAGILAGHAQAAAATAASINEAELDAYRKALRSFDWSYRYADDYGVWVAGHNQEQRLLHMRKRLDPDSTIWNEELARRSAV